MSDHNITVKDEIDDVIEKNGFDDHFHEHHGADKYKSSFVGKYIFSLDHKIISRQFLITGIIWAIIGAAFFQIIEELARHYTDKDDLVVGLMLVITILFAPMGMVGYFRIARAKWQAASAKRQLEKAA